VTNEKKPTYDSFYKKNMRHRKFDLAALRDLYGVEDDTGSGGASSSADEPLESPNPERDARLFLAPDTPPPSPSPQRQRTGPSPHSPQK
jgi:hypothetical protein